MREISYFPYGYASIHLSSTALVVTWVPTHCSLEWRLDVYKPPYGHGWSSCYMVQCPNPACMQKRRALLTPSVGCSLQERICFWRLPTISRPPMGLRNFSNQMQLLAKMIIAGTCARGFWLSSLSVKQVRLQLTYSDRCTHSCSSLSTGRATVISLTALPAATSAVHARAAATSW